MMVGDWALCVWMYVCVYYISHKSLKVPRVFVCVRRGACVCCAIAAVCVDFVLFFAFSLPAEDGYMYVRIY